MGRPNRERPARSRPFDPRHPWILRLHSFARRRRTAKVPPHAHLLDHPTPRCQVCAPAPRCRQNQRQWTPRLPPSTMTNLSRLSNIRTKKRGPGATLGSASRAVAGLGCGQLCSGRGASDARTLHLQRNCKHGGKARGWETGVPSHRADRAPPSGRARRTPVQLGGRVGCHGSQGCGTRDRAGASGGRVRACGARTTLDLPILACGRCEGFDVKLVSGEELLVVSIDLVDA